MAEKQNTNNMTTPSELQSLKETPLEELAPVFQILADRVLKHRTENSGRVPPSIFPNCLTIGGIYCCWEVVLQIEGGGYALKHREKGDQGWQGMYHVVGVAQTMVDNEEDVLARLSREIFEKQPTVLEDLRLMGIETHFEPERRATANTVIFRKKIANLDGLKGQWKIFTDLHDPIIVDHHQRTLQWCENPRRPLLNWSPIIIP